MHASYLSKIFNRREQDIVIREIKRIIKEQKLIFDGFVVTGVSGIAIGSIAARAVRKDLVIVRKDEEKTTHSSYNVENYKIGKSYIFLDDFISSGNTLRNVKLSLECCSDKNWLYGEIYEHNKSKIIGVMTYDGMSRTTSDGVSYITIGKIPKIFLNKQILIKTDIQS